MNYAQLETEVVAKLEPFMPAGVSVVPFPDSEQDLDGKPFIRGRITVMYVDSDFGDLGSNNMLRSTAQVVQNEELVLEVVIQSRFLRTGNDSLYALIALVKRTLLGFEPTHCHRIHAKKFKRVSDDQDASDLFTQVLHFSTSTLAVEAYDESSETIGTINQIQINDIYGNLQVPAE